MASSNLTPVNANKTHLDSSSALKVHSSPPERVQKLEAYLQRNDIQVCLNNKGTEENQPGQLPNGRKARWSQEEKMGMDKF